jgi:hypothetical protein
MTLGNTRGVGNLQDHTGSCAGGQKKHSLTVQAARRDERAANCGEDGDEGRRRPGKKEERLSQQDAGGECKSEEGDGTMHGVQREVTDNGAYGGAA